MQCENASYGLTVCAERNAICNAIANGETSIKLLQSILQIWKIAFPAEHADSLYLNFKKMMKLKIITTTKDKYVTHKINELLPEGFKL